MSLSPKMFLHNLGGTFGPHLGDPPINSTIRHVIFGPTAFDGTFEQLPQASPEHVDMYISKSLSAVTKEQILEDQFAVEGTFDNPPSEILEAVNAEFATFAVAYDGMNGSSEIRRGYSREIVDGELSPEPVIDDEGIKFFDDTHNGFGDDFISASPNASYWALLYGIDFIPPAGIAAISLTNKYAGYVSFTQSQSTAGTAVAP